MAARSKPSISGRSGIDAVLAAVAQLALASTWRSGLLVLAAIALLSPLAAAMVAIGAILGTAFAWAVGTYDRASWQCGMAGFNTAVVCLFWTGAFAAAEANLALFFATLALCIGLESLCRIVLTRPRLPALVLPAVLTLWGVSATMAPTGGWFWLDPPLIGSHPLLVAAAAALVLGAMALEAGRPALLSAAAALVALSGGIWLEVPAPSLFGLWGLNVPLAAFAIAGVFLRDSPIGLVLGALAALVAGLLWCIWSATVSPFGLPPLMAPFILSIWLTLVLARRPTGTAILQHAFWAGAAMVAAAGFSGRRVVVLLEAAMPWDSVIAEVGRWTWLDRDLPRDAYSIARYRETARCRQAYWEACDRLRLHEAARRELPISGADIVLDADPRPVRRADPVHRLAIRGSIEAVACIDCGAAAAWPPRGIWRIADLRCRTCGGLLKPDVDLLPEDARRAISLPNELQTGCVLILCGPISGDPCIDQILATARSGNGRVLQLIGERGCYPAGQHDHIIVGEPCRALVVLLWLLCLAQRGAGHARAPAGASAHDSGGRAVTRRRRRAGLILGAVGAIGIFPLLFARPSGLPWPVRAVPAEDIEIPSYTGGWDDIRTGRYRASPVTIRGRLYRPEGRAGPVPATVLLHGSDGVSDLEMHYAVRLAESGIAALAVDSFRPRGVESTVRDQKAVSAYTMTIDAYQALRQLADDPRIDAKKIAVIGWSKGGLAADLSSRTWYQVHLSRSDLRFAAHAAFYPWCGEQPLQPQQTGAPLLYLLGERDDWTGAETCRRYAERLRDSGYPAYGVVYPGAHHGFDHRGTFLRVVPQVEGLSGCAYLVQSGGFRDIRSDEIRDWSSFDTYLADCGRKGAHVGSNARARNAAWHDLLLFLSQALD